MSPRRRRTEEKIVPKKSVYFWLNIGFVVVLVGLVLGASAQPWFLVVAVIWAVAGFVVTARNRRNRPGPPNLFDDEPPVR
jgi:fatty acid desaturase